jgi:peptidoglycan hydrolase-like protein with peptidoglycan-binding domain
MVVPDWGYFRSPGKANMRTLRLNAKGDDVKVWQAFLRNQGLYEGELDGSFGPRLVEATQAFQRAHGLRDDGVAGNRTLGTAMQLGLDLASEDPPLPGGPRDGVASINDAWDPPSPPKDVDTVLTQDPRVITAHQPGQLPCPSNPPPPVGWAYWKGNVPHHVGDLANKVEYAPAKFPMGSFVQALIGGQLVAARVEWHDFQGATGKRGCFRGTSLFRPLANV